MYFNPMGFVDNLWRMGVGMLGIFIVIGVIIAVTIILNTVTTAKKKEQ